MHETERPIVIEDLDDEHLLVRADAVEGLEARLEEEVQSILSFSNATEMLTKPTLD